jgi:hypothetical protein
MGLLSPMITDKKELLCGLRHNEIFKLLDALLQKLSQVAELIFFEGLYRKWLLIVIKNTEIQLKMVL